MKQLVLFLAVAFLALGQPFAFAEAKGKGEKEQTFTGCLQEGSGPDSYRLTNASSEGSESGGVGESKEVELIAGDGVNLDAHVGHQVQVTGTSTAGDDEGGVAGLAPDPESEAEGELQLEVTDLQHIAESCQ